MRKPWTRSGSRVVNGVDLLLIVGWIADMAVADEATTLRIMGMPFLETLERGDNLAVKFLHGLLQSDPAGFHRFLSHPALHSGVADDQTTTIPLLFLETRNPEAATAIRALPWVQDGMTGVEPWTVLELQRLSLSSEEVFWAYVQQRGDIGGDLGIHVSTVRFLNSMAARDKEAVLRIVEMPFLETVELADYETLRYLHELAVASSGGLREVLSHPDLKDGITDDNVTTVWLLYLRWTDPLASAAIEAMSWVQDGIAPPFEYRRVSLAHPEIETYEHMLVTELLDLRRSSRQAMLGLARKPWLRDGLTSREVSAVLTLASLAQQDESLAVRVLEMPFLESIEGPDGEILEMLVELVRRSSEGARWLLSHPTLSDGIMDHDTALVALLALELVNPDAARAIRALAWVGDGIDPSERTRVLALQHMASGSQRVFDELMLAHKSWIEDGLTAEEAAIVDMLRLLSSETAIRLMGMPFFHEIDRVDVLAVRSLVSLKEGKRNDASRILSHPTLTGGITDDWAKIIAVMRVIEDSRQGLIDSLLDSDRVTVEERSIRLPLAGPVLLTVVRVEPVMPQAMDWLEHAIRSHEEFMGEAFPTSYVSLLIADATRFGGGGSRSGILTVDPGLGKSPISHEAAHVYWSTFSSWISEGGAELLTDVSLGKFRPLQGCSLVNNLAELERLLLDLIEEGGPRDPFDVIYFSGCNYVLGRSLFADLHRGLGSDAFQRGFRSLYLKMRSDVHEDECRGLERAVCYVKAAFVNDSEPETAEIAEQIIDRRYYGSPSED